MRIRILFILLTGLLNGTVSGQAGLHVDAALSRSRILIGDTLTLTVTVSGPAAMTPFVPVIDSLPHMEFREKPVFDTTKSETGWMIKGVYPLTSFDSGHWVIPALAVARGVQTNPLELDVVFSDFNPEQDYHDIKDIIPVAEKNKTAYWWNWLSGGLLVLIVMYVIFARKKKITAAPVVVVPRKDPFETAMKELDRLNPEELPEKVFYTRLTEIFRVYLRDQKNMHSLQKTSEDLLKQCRGIIAEDQLYQLLQSALQLADAVKFAKYQTLPTERRESFTAIRNSIQYIRQQEALPAE